MRCFLYLTVFILFATSAVGQTRKVMFRTVPTEGPEVLVDGESLGKANFRTINLGFNERKGLVEHEVIIRMSGYEDVRFVYNLDNLPSQPVKVVMERTTPKFNLVQPVVVDIDKLVSGIEYATEVGANTRWKYKYNEEINFDAKKSELIEALKKAGLETLEGQTDDLFDTGTKVVKTADVLLAGRVESFSLKRDGSSSFNYSNVQYVSEIKVNWQVFDRRKREILLKKTVTTTYRFSSSLITEEFMNAVVNNFYDFLSADGAFEEAIANRTFEPTDGVKGDSISSDDASYEVIDPAVALIEIPKPAMPEFDDISELVRLAMQASVTVLVDENRHGSGVVVSNNGYIVTNAHVVKGAKVIDIQFANGITLAGDVLTIDEAHDLALVKVRATGLTALPILENAEDLQIGAEVFVVGAPGDRELSQSVSKGIVSAKRNFDGVKVIQTDTKVSPGNSGSPLINNKGQIVGVINMKVVGDGIEGLSFAIDSRYLHSALGLIYKQ